MTQPKTAPREVTIASVDGLPLKALHWTRSDPRGVVVIAHGFGEHGGCYHRVAQRLGSSLGLEVLAPDQRGHGRSPGRRGVVRRYEELLGDIRAALDWAARERPGLPRFLLGHSNGGLVSMLLALEWGPGAPAPDGLILSNPALQIVTPITPAKLAIGRLLLRFAPGFTLSGKIGSEQMTRDPECQREHETDPLRHSRISAPLFFGMAAGGAVVCSGAPSITLPVLMLLGGSDPVIDPRASCRVFERLGSADKTLRLYPPMVHEPLNELGREEVFADLEAWLRPRLDGTATPPELGRPTRREDVLRS